MPRHQLSESEGYVEALPIANRMANACATPNLSDPYICEPGLMERVLLSADPAEGVKAFLEKREARFEEYKFYDEAKY